ncbi:MAG: hypothetical protein ABIO70_22100 [Pseudomonadota bacterium]
MSDHPPTANVLVRGSHHVFLTASRGFAVDADGTVPTSLDRLGDALFHAGEWVQASFGTHDNLFSHAALDEDGKRAVLVQLRGLLDADLGGLNLPQRQQLLGNIAGLTVELIKSVEPGGWLTPGHRAGRALIDQAFALLDGVLDDERLSPRIKRQLVGYLHEAEGFCARLTQAQGRSIDDKFLALNPADPFPYERWEAEGKDTIHVDNLSGVGEGFLYGFVRWLTERGLGDEQGYDGHHLLAVVSGDPGRDRGPVRLDVTIPANERINTWGRPMKVVVSLRSFQNDMLSGLEKEDVDIAGYDGHSGFGRNTLRSLEVPVQQRGHKLFYRHLCAGVDAENGIALAAPRAYANSYTTQESGFFHTCPGGPGGERYCCEAEGWEAVRCYIRAALGKKSHKELQADLAAFANWPGHSPGNRNNYVGPGDPRRGGAGDWDSDGIPNMYDVMPTVNTFDVREDVAREFELRAPDLPAGQIQGGRAFQALQFVNTATAYSTLLSALNTDRQLAANPQGVFFDGRDDPLVYVRFQRAPDGNTYVQLSSALASMTMESLRAVLYYETSRHLLGSHRTRHVRDHASLVAAGLLFAMASLEYDMSFRDRAVFDGLKRLYDIPDSVRFQDIDRAQAAADGRHNYCGDPQSLREILDACGDALEPEDVGVPSVAVQSLDRQ